MRKSSSIQLSLLLAAAAACSSRECLDEQGVRVDPAACAADAGVWHTTGFWGSGGYGYHSYYRGVTSSGGHVSSPSPVSRGGFGATGAAHSAAS